MRARVGAMRKGDELTLRAEYEDIRDACARCGISARIVRAGRGVYLVRRIA